MDYWSLAYLHREVSHLMHFICSFNIFQGPSWSLWGQTNTLCVFRVLVP